jgi:hypothetical protein
MEQFMKLAATFLFGMAMVPIVADAAQLKTPTVPPPKVSTPKVTVGNAPMTKVIDKSSPTLYLGTANGKHIGSRPPPHQ